ncbi:MAG: chromosome segregation protein SMC [Planctomycetia bacterium]
MTRLKALDLIGFKSFADRTRFEFPDGITVVVGPNGSGKSNVVDAIKWVLGEQSMRSLRGRDATDVIFAGSVSRKPLNVAEVALVFDNAARLLPVESDEVQIARRLYRSGESEYLVNGEIARLRDIRELFSGTGAATEAYSVIEQGRVDALLVASGRDRRLVFEEAAGITRFRARRAEALRRLERAEQSRQRLADIVGEVASRLETVTHQAKRARRWRTMTDTLRAFRVAAATQDLAAVDGTMSAIEASLREARERHAVAEGRAAEAAARLEECAVRERELLPQLEVAQARNSHEREQAAAAEARVVLLQARRRELAQELARSDDDLESARRSTRHVVGRIEAARADLDTLVAAAARIAAAQRACEEAAVGSHDDAASLRRIIDERADSLASLQRARIELQSAVDRTAARAAESLRSIDSWRSRIDAAQALLARVQQSTATLEGSLTALAKGRDGIAWELQGLEAAHADVAASLDEAWQTLASWKAKLEACGERKTMLAEMIERHEGLSDGARRLLGAASDVPGLAGALADLVVANEPWATLVDIALGSHAERLVVASLDPILDDGARWTEAEGIRAAMAAGGRVALVAADSLPEPPSFDPRGRDGVLGRLDQLVAASLGPSHADHDGLRRKLLGRVWVVESLHHAADVIAAAPAGIVVITRDGTSISTDGVFELGSLAATSGLISRRSEWRALEDRHRSLADTVAEQQRAIETLQARHADIQHRIRQAIARRQQAAEQIAAARAELARVAREEESSRGAIAEAEAGLHEAERQTVESARGREAAAAALAEHDSRIDASGADLAAARADLDALDRSRSDVIGEISRLRAERTVCDERIEEARRAVEATVGDAAIRRADFETASRRRQAAAERLASLEIDLLTASDVFSESILAAERAREVLTAVVGERAALTTSMGAHGADSAGARSEAAALAERIHALDLEAGEARHGRSRIIERIRDDYDIAIEEAAVPEAPVDADGAPIEIPTDRGELDQRIEELRRKLASMTTVNMEALAEADALTERLATLQAQFADVSGGKQAIEQLIARIDDESRRLLGETIETVRGHFRELFERVFGGGQADIVLDPDIDLLETSVEIVARPPGKEPRSISLLSGGEKTMTCVALLLAIFRSRPSPFCVLDEVDAALDEANVDRFVGVLRDFLSSTQFIVVTHSKKTMAAATNLYGVTMEESGVSKRVSVRFESNPASATKPQHKAA